MTIKAGASRLCALRSGKAGTVRPIKKSDGTGHRLCELGLTPGTHIRMLRRAPFGGPVLIKVRGYRLAVRHGYAASVLVKPQ